ncbi:MAG: UDP-N-acetylmuramoyl-L-alanyl-D-glutamate--2,6-diaminopimelate ligase [Planctomycetaceae bacterium]
MTFPAVSASISVSLRRLFPAASFVGRAEISVTEATDRSGDVRPGCLFAALPGTKVHGCAFVAEAISRGARAILTEKPIPYISVPQCVVRDVRAAYGQLCHTLLRWPSRRLGVVGVTGTNGKTSVTWMLRSILRASDADCGVSGTIERCDGRLARPAQLTTPDSRALAQWLAACHDNGLRYATLELSSHALEQSRSAGIELDAAIVTNITADHLDYHPDVNAYRSAKSRIINHLKRGGRLIVNADDAASLAIRELTPAHAGCMTFGCDSEADVEATEIREAATSARFTLRIGVETADVTLQLPGRFSISNALAAAGAADQLGIPIATIAAGLSNLSGVPGRMQRVDCGQPFNVIVDYAHTPDALERVIAAARRFTAGRVICVFGAGGDRDRKKRPAMGAAGAAADLVVLTSDNPRSEDPMTIIRQVLAGCPNHEPLIEPDRAAAIRQALDLASPGDCVLIAGKGHEQYQVIGEDRLPFDDIAVCREHLAGARHAVPSPHFIRSRTPAEFP